jgi:Zn-dependent protease
MIAPGAMMIGGQPSNAKDMLKISIAGVIVNMAFSVTFLTLALVIPFDSTSVLFYAALMFLAYINAFMALFNLIPFGVLDGYKIFVLNKKIWAVTFAASIALVIPTYLLFSQLCA